MFKLIKKRNNKKGFTLAELLIVVAIIAVLVAIAIPIFTSQLEKAREATDLANIRSAYAEASAAALSDEGKEVDNGDTKVTYTAATEKTAATYSAEVKITQASTGWVTSNPTCGGKDLSNLSVKSGDTVIVAVGTDGKVNISKKTETKNKTTTTDDKNTNP
jgi:prepilin-type N-terminal cleavage/methylation domain-containing protein